MLILLRRPNFLSQIKKLSSASDRVWLLGASLGLGFTLIGAYGFPYGQSPSGKFWAYAGLLIRAALYLSAQERLRERGGEVLFKLFLMGLVAGTFEILVDWGLIHWVQNGKLVYLSGNDVVLLGSPLWMPLAWACVIVEMGYPALRFFGLLRERVGEVGAFLFSSVIVAVLAGITVGFYEFFAYRAGWWKYEAAHAMLGGFCAVFIPLGEFFMFLPILPIAASMLEDKDRPLSAALRSGFVFSLSIAMGYALAYTLLEWGRMPRP